jgi:hypothetical protein
MVKYFFNRQFLNIWLLFLIVAPFTKRLFAILLKWSIILFNDDPMDIDGPNHFAYTQVFVDRLLIK